MNPFRFLKYFSGCIQIPAGSMGEFQSQHERLFGNLNGTCDKTIEKEYVVDQKPEQQLIPNVRFMFLHKGANIVPTKDIVGGG